MEENKQNPLNQEETQTVMGRTIDRLQEPEGNAPGSKKPSKLLIGGIAGGVVLVVILAIALAAGGPKSRLRGLWFSQGDGSQYIVEQDLTVAAFMHATDSQPFGRGALEYEKAENGMYKVTVHLSINKQWYETEYYLLKKDGRDWLAKLDSDGEIIERQSFRKGGA